MIHKFKLAVASFIVGVGLSGTAQANFVDFGDYLQDNSTDLQWLDVNASIGRSWDDINGQFGLGGDFEGWRFATMDEFNTLIWNWTGIEFNTMFRVFEEGLLDDLVQTLGPTFEDQHNAHIQGFLAETIEPSPDSRFTAYIIDADELTTHIDHILMSGAPSDAIRSEMGSYLGSYLVRSVSPVPAPAALPLALLGLGLVGIAYRKRKIAAKATV